jgi:hypothetical protein
MNATTASYATAIALSNNRQGYSPLIRGNKFETAFKLGLAYVQALGGDYVANKKEQKVAETCCLYGGRALSALKSAGRNRRALRRMKAHQL